ncbi:MAG: hypothetical protein KF696_04920 [Planctomycetes bacterium]|nr:hypothetical protein [Planctomycetota bacterium]MCW8134316.1 hypothetical protein [Planctomycetota bacterium]
MARILTGVLMIALSLAFFGCTSSKPMRFQFRVPTGSAQIQINEGSVYRGSTDQVYTLKSNDFEKTIELTWNGKKIYGKMDVYDHTALTRISVVPVHLTGDIVTAVDDFKAVTYVVYQRYRDANIRGTAGEDTSLRVYDYGDTVTREALIEQARLNGHVIAVIDFGNSQYIK